VRKARSLPRCITIPPLPEGSPAAAFIGAMYSTGYLKLVKVLEIVGGLLLVLPRLRTLGLVIIGAIVFNLACVHQFMFGGLKDPVVIFAVLACLFLTYVAWKKCCGCCSACPCGCQSDSSAGSCCSTESSSGCCGEKK
jgi:hypothetical protein